MRAIAHSPAFAKKVGVAQSVGKEFEMADKKKKMKFGSGGMPSTKPATPSKPPVAAPKRPRPGFDDIGSSEPDMGREPTDKDVRDMNKPRKLGRLGKLGYKGGGKAKKYAEGGAVKAMPKAKDMGSMNMAKGGKVGGDKAGRALVKKNADTSGRAMKFAKGGSIDGIAPKGKTNTKRVTMKRGGKC